LIIGSSVHPFAAWAAALLARRHRVPFVFEVRDLWPSTLIDMGKISSSGISARMLFRLESWLVRRAALIVVLMPGAVEYYQALGVDADRILVLPNGAEVPVESPISPIDSGCFTLMYCGAMGAANSLETLIDALALIESNWQGADKFQCRLIGDGPMRSVIENRASDLGLKSVLFEPPVAKEVVSQLLLEADAFVITLKDMPRLYRFGISMNKIFDYLAAGRPIVMAAAVSENPVTLSGGGVVVSPESPIELSEAILHLSQSPKMERDSMGLKAWNYVLKHYNYCHLAEKLALAMDDVIAKESECSK
jgi:glycosyltransferase involved in cell wall biosynthesis